MSVVSFGTHFGVLQGYAQIDWESKELLNLFVEDWDGQSNKKTYIDAQFEVCYK